VTSDLHIFRQIRAGSSNYREAVCLSRHSFGDGGISKRSLTSLYRPFALRKPPTVRAIAARWGSINQNKQNVQNKANFRNAEMFVTSVMTISKNKKL
jgi:hypothetical protein